MCSFVLLLFTPPSPPPPLIWLTNRKERRKKLRLRLTSMSKQLRVSSHGSRAVPLHALLAARKGPQKLQMGTREQTKYNV